MRAHPSGAHVITVYKGMYKEGCTEGFSCAGYTIAGPGIYMVHRGDTCWGYTGSYTYEGYVCGGYTGGYTYGEYTGGYTCDRYTIIHSCGQFVLGRARMLRFRHVADRDAAGHDTWRGHHVQHDTAHGVCAVLASNVMIYIGTKSMTLFDREGISPSCTGTHESRDMSIEETRTRARLHIG